MSCEGKQVTCMRHDDKCHVCDMVTSVMYVTSVMSHTSLEMRHDDKCYATYATSYVGGIDKCYATHATS